MSFRTVEWMQERLHTLHDEIDCLKYEAEKAAETERAKIVAWLIRETKDYAATDYGKSVRIIRKAIEAGEHLK